MRARHLQALVAITVAGAVLRFATLGVQSYWLDEVATVNLLHKGFDSMLSGVSAGESTPPLYYVLAWLWAKLFGTGEVGLRSLSALLGSATIPLAYTLGRRVAGRTTGLIAAALCAFNPLLVWYSQEARSYSLLVLLAGLTLLATLDARDNPTPRRLALWALASAAALATHYFAGFVIGAEAIWLLNSLKSREAAAIAAAAVVAVAAALLPLALHQHSTGNAHFISSSSLARRLAEVPKQFAIGYQGPLETPLTIVVALLMLFGATRLVSKMHRRDVPVVLAAIGLTGIVIPFVLAAIGPDYLIARNLIASWLPLAIAIAAGFAVPPTRLGVAATAIACAIGLGTVIAVASNERYQRDDWRGAAKALGKPTGLRAIVVTPASGAVPLLHYLPDARRVLPGGIDVTELDFVGLAPRLPGEAPNPPRPASVGAFLFHEYARNEAQTYTVVRERTGPATPGHITATVGGSSLDGRPAVVLYER